MTEFEQRFRLQTLGRSERTPSADFTDRVMSEIRRRAQHGSNLDDRGFTERVMSEIRRKRRNLRLWRSAAAAVAAVVLGLFFLPSQSPESAARAWLCSAQNSDGSWAPEKFGGSQHYRAALTALSALCLDAEPGKYRGEILKIRLPLEKIPSGETQADAYNRALAAFALVSLVQTGRYDELKPLSEQYLRTLVRSQTPAGAWTYDTSSGNAALTAWVVRVLALSHDDTSAVSLKKGLRWLEKCRRADGSFCYTPSGETATPTLNAMIACAFEAAGIRMPAHILPEDNYYSRYFAAESARKNTTDFSNLRTKIATSIAKNGRFLPDNRWSSVGGDLYAAAFTLLSL